MKKIDFNLFFKLNLLLTIPIFLLFLQYNQVYNPLSLILTLFGAISTASTLYFVLYIVFYITSYIKKILYILGIVFVFLNILLIIDFFIFRVYKFHINAMVINILLSPSAYESINIGVVPILLFILLFISFILFELYLIQKLFSTSFRKKDTLNKKINKFIIIPILLIILSEKVSYGISSLLSKSDIISSFKVIPIYQPLTFNRFASKYFDYKPDVKVENTIQINSKLNYPLDEIKLKKDLKKINIFIFASDAMRNSILSEKTTPNLEKLKKDSIVFNHHYSGGNSTRFGIFSLFYGLNSTYWFSFLSANRGPILFDVLKKLDYQIDIISSTNTDWPEFKKTCFVDISDHIKDNFEGEPWKKDESSSNYFLTNLDKYNLNKPIFNFVFLDSPHGYSFASEFNKFDHDDTEINYLTISKDSKELNRIFNRYKNAVYYNDYLISKMIEKLKKKDLYENSMIIVTSDHGQEFYEYGSFGHNSSFSNAQINSVLIVKLPKFMKSDIDLPKQYPNIMTSHVDIVPTILSIIGVKNSPNCYSNGKNIFDYNFKRNYVFVANWNNNAIVENNISYIFSNLPNKMFSNEIRDTKSYKKVSAESMNTKLLLNVINSNKQFLK